MSKIHIKNVAGTPELLDATTEELRVLLAIKERDTLDASVIAELCRLSLPRAKAAVSYWCEAGVVNEGTVTEEFEERLEGGISEESSLEVAKSIRDNSLAEMITECTLVMKRTLLNSGEIKKLTGLVTQYSLSPEYILTLAAWLSEKLEAQEKKLTVSKLVDRALSLHTQGIETPEALLEYIEREEKEGSIDREFRRIFGIYGRTVTPSEHAYFKKWSEEYGYFTDIVGEAYDICVGATAKLSLSYIDKILKGWFDASCRTLAECRAKHEFDSAERAKEKKEAKEKKPQGGTEKLRYGDFDIDDAFKKALARSYGTSGDGEPK